MSNTQAYGLSNCVESHVCRFLRSAYKTRSSRFWGKDDKVSFGHAESDESMGHPNRDVWSERKKDTWETLSHTWQLN